MVIFEVIDKTRVMPVDIPTVPNAENISKKCLASVNEVDH